MSNANYQKQQNFFSKKGQEGNEEVLKDLKRMEDEDKSKIYNDVKKIFDEQYKNLHLLLPKFDEYKKNKITEINKDDNKQLEGWSLVGRAYNNYSNPQVMIKLISMVVDRLYKNNKEVNVENVQQELKAMQQRLQAKHQQKIQQPQPKKEPMYTKLFKNLQQIPQSSPTQKNQQKHADLNIPQKSNQTNNNLNNSFTSAASTLNSSFTSTASLNNLQKQNYQQGVQTQSKLQQVKRWFSEKCNSITTSVSNLFSLKQKPDSASNITITHVSTQELQQNLQKDINKESNIKR